MGLYAFVQPTRVWRAEDFPAALPRPELGEDGHWRAVWPDPRLPANLSVSASRLDFHGELYNLADLRRRLNAWTAAPGQLLAWAHARWGDDFVHRLDGVYVLAWWRNGGLRLYRDPSGARSLYYTQLPGGGLAYATDLPTLLRLPGVVPRLARRSLHEYLRFLDVSAPHTLYEGIYAVEEGQLLVWTHAGLCSTHPRTPAPEPADSFPAAMEQSEDILRLAIERRLADAQRPAAFLSGGVDSSLICALAAPSQPKITAVTVGFAGERYDETPVAARVAKHLGLEHVVLRYRQADYRQAFAEFQRGAEQPVADPAVPPTLLAFRDCRQRFDVVLDGSGADEAAGLAPPRHVRIASQYAARLPLGLRRSLAGSLQCLPILAGYAPVFDFEHPAELAIRWRGFRRAEIEALCGEPVSLAHTRFYRTFEAFPRHAHFQRHSALLDAMPGDRLHQGARQAGLTLRFPFWDRTADACIRALPVDWRYRAGEPKRILRAILARHVPRVIWDLPKHGFDFPLQGLLQSEDYALVRRYLDADLWRPWQVLPAGAVAAYARRYMAGEGELVFRVWTLAVLAAWLETHAPARADAPAIGLDQAAALV